MDTGLRNQYSFLRTGSFDRLYTHNDDGTYAYGRKDLTGAAVVAVNRNQYAHQLTIDLAGYVPEGTVLRDPLNGGTYKVDGGQITVVLEGRWGAILISPRGVDLTPPAAPAAASRPSGAAGGRRFCRPELGRCTGCGRVPCLSQPG